MKNVEWDLYQLFLTVARSGGLTGAAETTSLSPATIGRRMLALEQSLGRALFLRRQTGYDLTPDGRVLSEQLAEMEAAARKVAIWQREGQGDSLVRIMAGTWNSLLISENIQALCTARDTFRLELTVAEQRANLAHREHDIGVRAVRPEEANLAARQFSDCAYAAYTVRNGDTGAASRFVAVAEEEAVSAYLQWPHSHAADRIAVTVSRPRAVLDLIRAGAGTGILPCFIGDLDPALERAGPEISELRHGQWLVMNSDDRHRPDIRTMIDRLMKLLKSHADLFAGKRPSRS
ncbi:LysR family transcriptional regulator [Pararhizobium sp.]|uniref:LysR family transcriptional regulator n=1 Tax=Pararhizobium sp. TaxID=1977563 RepID=UPI00271FDB68|nr:LysR family transcriptional regulator [Pararhizobium sp.]MDO9418285.1 LysR family transcriptional regulator [Pararhizobium sp.]